MKSFVRLAAAWLVIAVASGGGTPAAGALTVDLPRVCEGQPRDSVLSDKAALVVSLLSAADNLSGRFGIRLIEALSDERPGNTLVSPLGIGAVLAMVSPGATKPVRRAIAELIGAGGGEPGIGEGESGVAGSGGSGESGNAAGGDPAGDSADTDPARMLACQLAALPNAEAVVDDAVEVRFASGAFADRRLDLFPSFAAVLGERFGARVERLDFADESAVARINAWVSEATRDAIPVLVSELEPDDVLVLANAVHFRGEWTHRFDPERTAPARFRLRSGTSVEVPTMHATELQARYREDEGVQAIALPYGSGGFELVAVLPRAGVERVEALRRLASDPTWLGGRGFRRTRGSLSLPRLNLATEASLLPALRALGLGSAIDDAQAFAGIAAPAPMLSRVLHRTMLVLDERGTEAAAATAAVMTTRAAVVEPEPFEMRVDRPFALAVRYRPTGAVLFAAWIENPASG